MKALSKTWKHWRYEYYLEVRRQNDYIWLSIRNEKADMRPVPGGKRYIPNWIKTKIGSSVRWPPGATYSTYNPKQDSILTHTDDDPIGRLKAAMLEHASTVRENAPRLSRTAEQCAERLNGIMTAEHQTALLEAAQAVVDYWENGGKDKTYYDAKRQFEQAPVRFLSPSLGSFRPLFDPDD